MFKMFKKLFGSNKPGRVKEVDDPVLDRLTASEDGDWWEASVNLKGRVVRFSIRGELTPDPTRLAHVYEIVKNYEAFEQRVMDFLEKEARENEATGKDWKKEMAAEIRKLAIEDISLTHPKHPRDGMIFFGGPDEDRAWRCDYVDGAPKFLGYDD